MWKHRRITGLGVTALRAGAVHIDIVIVARLAGLWIGTEGAWTL
jgi:hypothetical protein